MLTFDELVADHRDLSDGPPESERSKAEEPTEDL